MIRINLLSPGAERTLTPVQAAAAPTASRISMIASVLFLVTVIGLGGWFWTLRRQSAAVDAEIVRVRAESQRLDTVLAKVKTFEARKAELQQRVALIERLRTGQSAPVRVLDQISRSVPDHLWLADLTQNGADFTIGGFATSMTALSDFAAAMEATRWFRKPVEIIDSQVASDAKTGDLVRFVLKASYVDPDAPTPPPAPAPAAAPKR